MRTPNELTESEHEDARLAQEARAGNHAAFNRLMDKHQETLLRFLAGHIRSLDDAQDIAQDTFVAVYKNLERFDPNRPFLAWLFVIARNKARDHHRRRRTLNWVGIESERDEFVAEAPDPESAAVSTSELARAHDIIQKMPEGLRTPLLLSVVDEMPLVRIGEIMGVSTKAVEVRIYRARKLLKEHFYA